MFIAKDSNRAHAGRKASTYAPWLRDSLVSDPPISTNGNNWCPKEVGGWQDVWAPTDQPFNESYPKPQAMTLDQIQQVIDAFVEATKRSLEAGYDAVELHGAHGYLLHSFVSPLSNTRTDKYGGSLDNRLRFALDVVKAVRAAWPAEKPLFYRLSASDWHEVSLFPIPLITD